MRSVRPKRRPLVRAVKSPLAAGRSSVTLSLTRAGHKKLNRSFAKAKRRARATKNPALRVGRVKCRVRLIYVPNGGAPVTVVANFEFLKR